MTVLRSSSGTTNAPSAGISRESGKRSTTARQAGAERRTAINVQLCCGHNIFPRWINVDCEDFGQEVVADLAQPWSFLESSSVDRIFCKDGFEHQASLQHFLAEAARVLKPGGELEVWVPHYKNPSAYRLTHFHYFSWSCFNIYPEPHDAVQDLRVILNRLYVGREHTTVWKPFHTVINLFPKWWERLFYVSNIQVVFQKAAASRPSAE